MASDKKEEEADDGPKWRPSFCDECKQPIVFRKPIPGGKLTSEQASVILNILFHPTLDV